MRSNSLSAICLSLLLVLLAAPVYAVDPIEIDVDVANPPFMYELNGHAVGIYPAILRAVFKQMHVPVHVVAKPWARALSEIDNAQAGIGGIYKTSARELKYDYSDALFVERILVYVPKPKPFEFSNVSDLSGRRIGVINGWSYGDAFDALRRAKSIQVEAVISDAQNFGKLNMGRLDAALAIAESGRSLLLSGSYPNVTALPQPLTANPTYLAFNKQAQQLGLLQQFNAALETLQADGSIETLLTQELNRK